MKDVRYLCILAVVFFLVAVVAEVGANPFTQKKKVDKADNQVVDSTPPHGNKLPTSFINKLMVKVISWQQEIRTRMSSMIRASKTTGNLVPLLWVLGMGLVYGILHSAGPGHGKAIALSYIIGFNPSVVKALIFGNVLAFCHGLSAVVLVLGVKLVFQVSMGESLASVTQASQVISYSLVILMGLLLLFKPVFFRNRDKNNPEEHSSTDGKHTQPPVASALAIGMIPCPGVVIAMVFCISMELTLFGILLAIAISTGMAITLSAVSITAAVGKKALMQGTSMSFTEQWVARLEPWVESAAGFVVAGLGLFFLLGSFSA